MSRQNKYKAEMNCQFEIELPPSINHGRVRTHLYKGDSRYEFSCKDSLGTRS